MGGMLSGERVECLSVVVFGWNAHMNYFVGGMLAGEKVECSVHSWFCDNLTDPCIKQRN